MSITQVPILKQLWQRIESAPPPEPEDSLLLRVLVQGLVTLGIIAVDVAAADTVDPLGISFWAVPVSVVGAGWSWVNRRKRNVAVKFCIAIAMLVALGLFFVRLIAERNDTRLALAELLIQLQVFHSFDLPRRKDLGYSIVIGLILMGVAATLSQTLMFAPFLIVFLALAIPVLILDYRSRLGLLPQGFQNMGADLSPRRLSLILLAILAVGLTIFAVLPRLPGYQLRTFPVSAPIEFEGQFDGDQIINPGYVQFGRGDGGDAVGFGVNGTLPGQPGRVDPNQYYGFNLQMNQNLRGEMQPTVVMRVRSQAEGFWRVMAFDRYTGQGWEVTRNQEDDLMKLDRPRWSLRFNLPWSVTLNRTREVVQSYTIVSDLPNLLPALYEPKDVYFPTRQIALDKEGALRSPVPLAEGMTYTVVSEVPYRDRTRLRSAPTTYPRYITDYYLQIPQKTLGRVRQKTEAVLAGSPKVLTDFYEQSLYLAQYLKQNYSIQPNLPYLEPGEDLVEAFLFKYQGGYPDHFSTVLTVMLRSIGIPARLVVGYRSGEFNPFTGYYVVRNTDAVALTEVCFHKYGWFMFNPIPGDDVVPTSVEESQVFGVLRAFWAWLAGWLPSPVVGWLNGVFDLLTSAFGWLVSRLVSVFNWGWVGVLLGIVLVTALVFLGWLLWCGWQAWRFQRWLARQHPMEALYQRMLRQLSAQGMHKAKAQTPLEFAAQCRGQHPPTQAELVEQICSAYVRWRYGGQAEDWAALWQQWRSLQRRSWPR